MIVVYLVVVVAISWRFVLVSTITITILLVEIIIKSCRHFSSRIIVIVGISFRRGVLLIVVSTCLISVFRISV